MPCIDGRECDLEEAEEKRIDFLVRSLCTVCEYLVDHGNAKVLPAEIYTWYVEHKKVDWERKYGNTNV